MRGRDETSRPESSGPTLILSELWPILPYPAARLWLSVLKPVANSLCQIRTGLEGTDASSASVQRQANLDSALYS